MLFRTQHGFALARMAEELAPMDPGAMREPSFCYYFPDAERISHDETTAARLDALGAAMVAEAGEAEDQDSRTPPIFTYLGQFIDHDIVATSYRALPQTDIDAEGLAPLERAKVVAGLENERTGFLDLDSVYGTENPGNPFVDKLVKLMRHPRLAGKMLIARPEIVGPDDDPFFVPVPEDGASDLLRLGRFLGREITRAELEAIPDPRLRDVFFLRDAEGRVVGPNLHRAIIGDARNDENLFVAQFQLALLRFHNRVVDSCADAGLVAAGSDALFAWARRQVRWTFQWLVVNAYLRRLCDPQSLDWVIEGEAPLYTCLLGANGSNGVRKRLPVPIEFAAAAFRFGHSMVRERYDWNRFFGRAVDGAAQISERAALRDLFAFAGHSADPMKGVTEARLPSNWPAEWSRLALEPAGFKDRAARKIDTRLAPPLGHLPREASAAMRRRIRNLAIRNLRRGHLLNLPSAQACIAEIRAATGHSIAPLAVSDLTSGTTGRALKDADMVSETPLWFYVLKEAETLNYGDRLGPLGSCLVANTLVGLIANDPNSYWQHRGVEGRWSPADGAQPAGEPVDSLPALLRAALLL